MACILVVDDSEENRCAIRRALGSNGHRVVEADGGTCALAVAKSESIDLALVDFVMPGIDGIETGQRLKAEVSPDFLPVILVTAMDERALRIRGLGVVDDFIARPFDVDELRVRTENLLRLREREIAFRRQAAELAELNRFREEMFSLVIHDLKNPLSVVVANMAYAAQSLADDEARIALREADLAAKRQLRLIANLLDLARLETNRLVAHRRPMTLAALVLPLVAARQFIADSRQIAVEVEGNLEQEFPLDADLLSRVLDNLLDNALRYAPQGGRIVVSSRTDGSDLVLTVGNSGPAIPADFREQIFEKFGQATPPVGRMNLGLGLYFCRLAVEAHGGSLWVEERNALPTVFYIRIPAQS